jgi:hypothetical protein
MMSGPRPAKASMELTDHGRGVFDDVMKKRGGGDVIGIARRVQQPRDLGLDDRFASCHGCGLHLALHRRELPWAPTRRTVTVLVAIGLLGTFPPVYQFLAERLSGTPLPSAADRQAAVEDLQIDY